MSYSERMNEIEEWAEYIAKIVTAYYNKIATIIPDVLTNNTVESESRFAMLHSRLVPFMVTFLSTVIIMIDSMCSSFTNSVIAMVSSFVKVTVMFISKWCMSYSVKVLS